MRSCTFSRQTVEKYIIATSAAIDMGVDVSRTAIYLGNDYVDFKTFWMIPVLVVISFAGSWIGKMIINRIPQKSFQLIVLLLILLIGIASILKHFFIETV